MDHTTSCGPHGPLAFLPLSSSCRWHSCLHACVSHTSAPRLTTPRSDGIGSSSAIVIGRGPDFLYLAYLAWAPRRHIPSKPRRGVLARAGGAHKSIIPTPANHYFNLHVAGVRILMRSTCPMLLIIWRGPSVPKPRAAFSLTYVPNHQNRFCCAGAQIHANCF